MVDFLEAAAEEEAAAAARLRSLRLWLMRCGR